eukprot:GHVU01234884.1.p1 GENE.GHVU01234884.1~~GHVU01234884.1.p1  ORF type:complete len:101 (-),score=8.16 GHVU01234884.1:153-455(-)
MNACVHEWMGECSSNSLCPARRARLAADGWMMDGWHGAQSELKLAYRCVCLCRSNTDIRFPASSSNSIRSGEDEDGPSIEKSRVSHLPLVVMITHGYDSR